MTLRSVLLLALVACAKQEPHPNADLARARVRLDELARSAEGPVFDPPTAADALLPKGPALSACAPARSDVGVLVDGGKAVAFDRNLARDAAMEACLQAALPPLEGRVVFIPASLPGGKPQVLRLEPGGAAPDLDRFDPKLELSLVVAKGTAPESITPIVERLRDKGFEKLVIHVEE